MFRLNFIEKKRLMFMNSISRYDMKYIFILYFIEIMLVLFYVKKMVNF